MIHNLVSTVFKQRPTIDDNINEAINVASAIKETEPTEPRTKERPIKINDIPPGIMAYMGDGIFELIVRNFFIQRGLWDSHKMHRQVIQFVNAGAQATLLRDLEDQLTDEEKNILRRARNSNAGNVPRHAKVTDYRYSTAFEAVLGYVTLKGDFQRLQKLVELIEDYLRKQISGKNS